MKIINYNHVTVEEANEIMEFMGYEVNPEEETSSEEVLEEDYKKGYPEKGIKPGTKAAKEEEEESDDEDDEDVEESVSTGENTISEYVEFDGEAYTLSEDLYQDNDGEFYLHLQKIDEAKLKGLPKNAKKLQLAVDKEKEKEVSHGGG